ncbi:hypothetical protein ABE244_25585 [Bacillus toyonensis]|uniref:hypothetical protein n=1 Tax=Bacillus toyonensis TaxID=155322 RepID=UPI003D210627
MSKIDKLTWREQRHTIKTNDVTTIFFSDTMPNHILVTNPSAAFLFLSVKGDASETNYNIKIPANAQKLLPRPIGSDRCSFYHNLGNDVEITVATWEGDFEAASLSQSLETVSIDPTSPEVEIANDKGNPIPVTGSVTVSSFPATQEVTGSVGVNNFPAVQPVSGTIDVTNFPATQNVVMTGNKAQQPFTGTSTQTFNFTGSMNALVLHNSGASDLTVQVAGYTFAVKAGKSFDEYVAPFSEVIVTATTQYNGYVRG